MLANISKLGLKESVSIRIKDIAKMAGVSVGTVDRVLHDRGKVSDFALAKVTEVLNKINYKPNLIARSLGKGKKQKVSVLTINPEFDPYWKEVYQGIKQAREEWEHYGVVIEPHFYMHDGEMALENMALKALETQPDGVVMAPLFHPQALPVIQQLKENNIPYVLFNTDIPEAEPLSFIGQDLYQSGQLAGRLMSLGKNREELIAVLHVGEDVKDSVYLMEKERGFRSFYKDHSLTCSRIESHSFELSKHSLQSGLRSLFENENLKGVFVTTSHATSVVAEVLSENGKDGVCLIGYDMLEENLKYLKKGTINFLINQNPKRQAFLGITHMANHLLFKKRIPTTDLFPLEIITQQNVDSYLASTIH